MIYTINIQEIIKEHESNEEIKEALIRKDAIKQKVLKALKYSYKKTFKSPLYDYEKPIMQKNHTIGEQLKSTIYEY